MTNAKLEALRKSVMKMAADDLDGYVLQKMYDSAKEMPKLPRYTTEELIELVRQEEEDIKAGVPGYSMEEMYKEFGRWL